MKIIIRVEDERREIGDLFRAALEGAGFQVQPVYQPFGPATLAVYASDPITFQWHAYTEGWSRSAPDRYDFGTINQMYRPVARQHARLAGDRILAVRERSHRPIGQQLYRGEFGSQDERDDLYREMTSMGLDESVRLWLATALQTFPAREELENLNIDIVGGPKSALSLREASVPGSEEIRVGNLWVWTDRTVWNPVGGFGDAYSSDIYKNLVDAPVINHPFSGLPIPFRATFETETAGPDGTLDVPEDAVLWDAVADAWTPVGAGVTAVSKVTYDYSQYFQAPFHHGAADHPGRPDLLDRSGLGDGLRREPHPDRDGIGHHRSPVSGDLQGIPACSTTTASKPTSTSGTSSRLHRLVRDCRRLQHPMGTALRHGRCRLFRAARGYSDTAAARFSVPWLSLVTETDARLVIRTIRRLQGDARSQRPFSTSTAAIWSPPRRRMPGIKPASTGSTRRICSSSPTDRSF